MSAGKVNDPRPQLHIGIHPDAPVAATTDFARRVEATEFSGLWIADSQDLFRDCFVSMTAAALATESLTLTTGVTNPVLRHPRVLAGGIGSLEELAPGRIGLGLGSGETAVQTANLRGATLTELRQAVEMIRGVTADSWGSGPRQVPIALAATGPKGLRVAGEVADTAYVKIGAEAALVDWARHQLQQAVRHHTSSECTMTLMVPVALANSRTEAYREVAGFAAATAAAVTAAIPPDVVPPALRDPLAEVATMVAHARSTKTYAAWLDDPSLIGDLPPAVLDAFSIASDDPDEIVETVCSLEADVVVMPLLTSRRIEQLEILDEAFSSAKPACREQPQLPSHRGDNATVTET
jgi:alkanesulfonate monooxygenase SsuD/methylene tetrahydromethanopterin reductase-like flavin-dependent oxidoreductase (luciferase family)